MPARLSRRHVVSHPLHVGKPKGGGKVEYPHPGTRMGMVKNVAKHGLKSWSMRGGGTGASYKD